MKAPLPNFTSRTKASLPPASFLLMMLEAIKDTSSTVAVVSLKAYIFLSAGTRSAVCPTTAIPCFFTLFMNSSKERDVLKPGMDSSLSIVPPVWPKALPDILATITPQDATRGATTSVVLSPTPPVECLSTFFPGMDERSRVSPDLIIVSVKKYVSSSSRCWKYIAIRKADIW